MRQKDDPLSDEPAHRRAVEAQARRDTLLMVALFTGVMLVNGIIAIVVIEVMQVLGWWPEPSSEGPRDATSEVAALLSR